MREVKKVSCNLLIWNSQAKLIRNSIRFLLSIYRGLGNIHFSCVIGTAYLERFVWYCQSILNIMYSNIFLQKEIDSSIASGSSDRIDCVAQIIFYTVEYKTCHLLPTNPQECSQWCIENIVPLLTVLGRDSMENTTSSRHVKILHLFFVLLLCSIPVCYGTPLGIFRINKEEIGIFNVKFNLLWFLLILWVRQNPNRVYPCFDGMSCHSSVDERALLLQYYTELSRFHCSYWNDKVYVVNELKILVC